MNLKQILPFLQIGTSIILIILIILQQRGTALGSAFGGQGGGFYATRRGVQKKMLWATVIFAVLFIVFSLLNLVI